MKKTPVSFVTPRIQRPAYSSPFFITCLRDRFLGILTLALLVSCAQIQAADYFVSADGNDSNDGKSMTSPWRTIDRTQYAYLWAGESISFRGGDTFSGTIGAWYSGVAGNPIVYKSYGSGRATINAGNYTGCTLRGAYITVSNLNFVGAGRKTGNTGTGIEIEGPYVQIDNVNVTGFQHEGIKVRSSNVHITNVDSSGNGESGISAWNDSSSGTFMTDLYIGHCKTNYNPGDPTATKWTGSGIVIGGWDGATVEYCEAGHNCGDMPQADGGPYAIWCFSAKHILIQYCIAHDTMTNGHDGGGIDMDGGTTDSTVQYCLTYGNQGSGYGMYEYPTNNTWSRNTLRYCISQNDGTKRNATALNLAVWGTSPSNFTGAYVYNNVFYKDRYNDDGAADGLVAFGGTSSIPSGSVFCNNVFVSNNTFLKVLWSGSMEYNNINVLGNCYYKIGGGFDQDSIHSLNEWSMAQGTERINGSLVGINADPLIAAMSTPLTVTNPDALTSMSAFKLLPGSPCIDRGISLKQVTGIDSGTHDFFGNVGLPHHGIYDIGANESDAPSLAPHSGGIYAVFAKHSEKALDLTGFGAADGTLIEQWAFTGYTNQQWRLDDMGGGAWRFTSLTSGKMMDVEARSQLDGAQVLSWSDNGGDNQRWYLSDVGGGWFKVISKSSGKCLDASGNSLSDGAKVQQWTDNGGNNQLWRFDPIAPSGIAQNAPGSGAQPVINATISVVSP